MSETLNPKSRGLGRGLNALFEDEEEFGGGSSEGEASGGGVSKSTLGPEQLRPGSLQPRHHFDDEAIAELAESIKAHGVLQPLLVRPDPKQDGMYEIIAGERRWRASQKAQLHELPVIILDLPDEKVLEVALVENLQREDLSPVEEARGYRQLIEEHGHTQEKLAAMMGKSRPHISNTMRLLELPAKVQEWLEEGALTAGHARALLTTPDPEALAKHVIKEGFSVRQTERYAQENLGKKPKAKSASKETYKDADTVQLEKDLSDMLGMKVVIHGNAAGAGSLQVYYKSLDQLDEVIHRLSKIPKVVEAEHNPSLPVGEGNPPPRLRD